MSSLVTDPIQSCTEMLVRSAKHLDDENSIRMAAARIARELIESCGEDSAEVLAQAAEQATQELDQSDLDRDQFASALTHLHDLQIAVIAHLRRFGL